MKKLILIVIIFSIFAEVSFSNNERASGNDGQISFFSAGAGVIITEDPYKGIDTKSQGIPFFLYRTERLSLFGPMIRYLIFEDDDWELDALTKIRFEGYEEGDSRFLQDMDERKWTLELGGSLSKVFPIGDITADFSADILNEHKGHELRLFYSYDFGDAFNSLALTVTPNIGLIYRNSKLNDYYYGVRESEINASRPEYNVGDSTGLMAGLRINYIYNENLSLVGIISYEWLGSEIRHSPIVDKDFLESFLFGILYRF